MSASNVPTKSVPTIINDAISALSLLLPLEASIQEAASRIEKSLLAGHKILACGNGGSAADCSHFTTEIACRFMGDRRPFPAISFTSDGGLLTANANDYSFEDVFSRQVVAFGQPGDVLVAFTTSGQSPNIRRALETAREMDLTSIAVLGRDGGSCKGLGTVELIVPHQSTARIQEAHKVLIHILCELVEPALRLKPDHRSVRSA